MGETFLLIDLEKIWGTFLKFNHETILRQLYNFEVNIQKSWFVICSCAQIYIKVDITSKSISHNAYNEQGRNF